jgi:hypothetical protein
MRSVDVTGPVRLLEALYPMNRGRMGTWPINYCDETLRSAK